MSEKISEILQQKLQQKKETNGKTATISPKKKTATKTATTAKKASKHDLLEKRFISFQNKVEKELQQLQQKLQHENQILPEEIRNDLIALLKADYRRFIKWNYSGYVQYVENIADFFKIKLTKPKKKEDKGK